MGSRKKSQNKQSSSNINEAGISIEKSFSENLISIKKVNVVIETPIKPDESTKPQSIPLISKQKLFRNVLETVKNGLSKELLDKEHIEEENDSKLNKRYNFLGPIYYESTIMLSNLIQLNTLLSNLLLPIINIFRRKNFKTNFFNLLKIVVLSHIIIKEVNTSRLYHLIKLQSYMKIFALINFLQLIEKLTSTILVDLTTSKNSRTLSFLIQLPILFLNSLVIIMQALTYNVIINSRNNKKLNILLITISFNKLKSTTFKKFNSSSLFQVILQDSNDRFQLNLALLIVCLKNYYNLSKIIQLIVVTILTDWMHQLFIIRYNNIDTDIFSTFKEIMIYDYEKKNVIYRLGMPVDGHIITCIVLLYRRKIAVTTWIIFCLSFIISKSILLFVLEKLLERFKLNTSSTSESSEAISMANDITRFTKGSFKDSSAGISGRSLSEIVRYEMNGKKIF